MFFEKSFKGMYGSRVMALVAASLGGLMGATESHAYIACPSNLAVDLIHPAVGNLRYYFGNFSSAAIPAGGNKARYYPGMAMEAVLSSSKIGCGATTTSQTSIPIDVVYRISGGKDFTAIKAVGPGRGTYNEAALGVTHVDASVQYMNAGWGNDPSVPAYEKGAYDRRAKGMFTVIPNGNPLGIAFRGSFVQRREFFESGVNFANTKVTTFTNTGVAPWVTGSKALAGTLRVTNRHTTWATVYYTGGTTGEKYDTYVNILSCPDALTAVISSPGWDSQTRHAFVTDSFLNRAGAGIYDLTCRYTIPAEKLKMGVLRNRPASVKGISGYGFAE